MPNKFIFSKHQKAVASGILSVTAFLLYLIQVSDDLMDSMFVIACLL